jgi:predicted dithiol-disulfide oxidoreductase (DUF899 family)
MQWSFPWASSANTDFNTDYAVSFTKEQQEEGVEYNFRREAKYTPETAAQSGAFQWREGQDAGEGVEQTLAKMSGVNVPTYHRERPGLSLCPRRRRRVPHVFCLRARSARNLGDVPMVRPGAKGQKREWCMVETS